MGSRICAEEEQQRERVLVSKEEVGVLERQHN